MCGEPDLPDITRYGCDLCSYVYDPAKGDMTSAIAPPRPFDQLPEDWTCPQCGAAKKWFRPVG